LRRDPPRASHSVSTPAIPTAGKIFADGTLLELIEDLEQPDGLTLLMWDGQKQVTARQAEINGQSYIPLMLDPGLRRAVRLPDSFSLVSSTAELFAELIETARRFTDLSETSCELLIGFVFASWLADCLLIPINLLLWSPIASETARVLRLLSCLCRQGLPLSGFSARNLALLPAELQPTLLIFRPASSRRTIEALSICGWSGFHTVRSGQFGEFIGSVALSTECPLPDRSFAPAIEIAVPVSTRPLPVLDSRTQQRLASEFLPRLLTYRLTHYRGVACGSPDVDSTPPALQIAAGIGACFADVPELRDRQLALLAEVSQVEPNAGSADPRVPLIEAIWARSHETGRERLYVAEIAADLNAILSLDGHLPLSCRMVGGLLKGLGIRTLRLDRQGRGIKLSASVRRQVHDLAATYDVPSRAELRPGCKECSPRQTLAR
jgi:hypothetical protein